MIELLEMLHQRSKVNVAIIPVERSLAQFESNKSMKPLQPVDLSEREYVAAVLFDVESEDLPAGEVELDQRCSLGETRRDLASVG
jgi:hypothetical protein